MLLTQYANPYFFIDELILNCDFFEWVCSFIKQTNERRLYDVWLHKIHDRSFTEYKQWVYDHTQETTAEQLETTVNESMQILNKFNPKGGADN